MSHNYLRRMLDMLTGAYNRNDMRSADKGEPPATNIGKLFDTLAWGLELVHDSAETIRLWDDIDKAIGATLDRYGANFGVAREGSDDEFYRLLIKVKMLAQISGGDVDTVIRAVSSLFSIEPEQVDFREIYPAKTRAIIDDAYLDEARIRLAPIITKLTKRILAAGVGFDVTLLAKREVAAPVYIGMEIVERQIITINQQGSVPPPALMTLRAGTYVRQYERIAIG